MSKLPRPELTTGSALAPVSIAGRSHLPSNELTAEGYAPIYHHTKERMEKIFGQRDEQLWPQRELTCSNCYSVMPPLKTLFG